MKVYAMLFFTLHMIIEEMITHHMFHINIKWIQKAFCYLKSNDSKLQNCMYNGESGKMWKQSSKSANMRYGRSAKLQKRSSNISITPSSQQHCAFTFSHFFVAPSHISSLPSYICTFPFAFLYLPESVRCDCPYQNTMHNYQLLVY